MRDKAIVVDVKEDFVTVVPLITNACISCSSPCTKRGNPFKVLNKKNYAVEKGNLVKIGASKATQAVQGIVSLILPVIAAICGYFFSPAIISLFSKSGAAEVTEGKRAAFVLAFLFLSGLIVFIFSRNSARLGNSEILEVI